jgi:hypothetical protein
MRWIAVQLEDWPLAVAVPFMAVALSIVVVLPSVVAVPVVFAVPLPDAVADPEVWVVEPVTMAWVLILESSTLPSFQSRSFLAPKATHASMQLKSVSVVTFIVYPSFFLLFLLRGRVAPL